MHASAAFQLASDASNLAIFASAPERFPSSYKIAAFSVISAAASVAVYACAMGN